jgi:hypothetical protein
MKYIITAVIIVSALTCGYSQSTKENLRDFPQLKVATFKVYGTCGDCQRRILSAAAIKGVRSAYWDWEDQLLTVQFNERLINQDAIQSAVALAGHDTEKFNAPDKTYERLPACCHYIRIKKLALFNSLLLK